MLVTRGFEGNVKGLLSRWGGVKVVSIIRGCILSLGGCRIGALFLWRKFFVFFLNSAAYTLGTRCTRSADYHLLHVCKSAPQLVCYSSSRLHNGA